MENNEQVERNWAKRQGDAEKLKAYSALEKAKEVERQRLESKTHKYIKTHDQFGKPILVLARCKDQVENKKRR